MVVHTITSKLGVFSATLSLAHLVLVHHFPGMLSDMMLEYYLVTFFYALYFGMLGQDFASICTEYVSNSLGVRLALSCCDLSLDLCSCATNQGSRSARSARKCAACARFHWTNRHL